MIVRAALGYPYPLLGLVGFVVRAVGIIDLLLSKGLLDFYGITNRVSRIQAWEECRSSLLSNNINPVTFYTIPYMVL